MTTQGAEIAVKLAENRGVETSSSFEARARQWLFGDKKRQWNKLVEMLEGRKEATQFLVSFFNSVQEQPYLLRCPFDKVMAKVLEAAACGLSLSKANPEAAIVAYKTDPTLIVQYQGLAKLAYQGGFIKAIWGSVVCEKDEFDLMEGTARQLHHKPFRASREQRGEAIAAYACFKSIYDNVEFVVLWADEIQKIRNKSPGSKSEYSPWNAKELFIVDQMWVKSALRRLLKLVPKSTRLTRALEHDEAVPAESVVTINTEAILESELETTGDKDE